jgi:DNA-binding MarR family transcriptional regulator
LEDAKEKRMKDAGYVISLIKKELDQRKNNDIKEFNITHQQLHVVMYLIHHNEEKIFQKDIESEMQITAATASGIIARLESNGFIKRTPLETDSRYKYLTPTKKAYEFKDIIISRCRKSEEAIFAGFKDEEKNMVLSYLERIYNNLKEN